MYLIYNSIKKRKNHLKVKGFGKVYFSLVAIQAFVSTMKIIAYLSAVRTCSGKPLKIKINSPPSA